MRIKMEPIEYLGIIAMILGIMHSLPQLYKIHTTGNVSSFSIHSVYLSLLSLSLWAYYEGTKKQYINLTSVIISILVELWILTKMKR